MKMFIKNIVKKSYLLILVFFFLFSTSIINAEQYYTGTSRKSPFLAGLCSFITFGLGGGQFYNGDVTKGILMIFLLGPGYRLWVSISDAWASANEINRKIEMGPLSDRFRSPERAAFWSVAVPLCGGQIYNGQIGKALLYPVLGWTPVLLAQGDVSFIDLDTAGLIYFIMYLVSIEDAYRTAKKHNSFIEKNFKISYDTCGEKFLASVNSRF